MYDAYSLSGLYGASQKCWRSMFETTMVPFIEYLPGQSSCHLYMAYQLLQNMTSSPIKVKKGTGHVFYMATPSHAIESALDNIKTVLSSSQSVFMRS